MSVLGAFCLNKKWGAVPMAAASRLAPAFSCVRLGMSKWGKRMGWAERKLRGGDSGCVGGQQVSDNLYRFVKLHSLPFLTNTGHC